MATSTDGPPRRRRLRSAGGVPVYTFEQVPGVPPITVMRFPQPATGQRVHDHGPERAHAHSHAVLMLSFFERGGGRVRLGRRWWPITDGDAFIVAPGDVVEVRDDADWMHAAVGWAVAFPADVLGADESDRFLSWRTTPLLLPFVRGGGDGGTFRVAVPPDQQAVWSRRFAALADELARREDGYREAALAHLTLLLVDLSRLAGDVVSGLRLHEEPLLAQVFAVIEQRVGEPLSLRDVADAVGLSPGHLTTVVRDKTGRTVGDWITERRLARARRLLVETDLSVEQVGRRVGYRDPAYFARVFRRANGTTPLRWRRAGRG